MPTTPADISWDDLKGVGDYHFMTKVRECSSSLFRFLSFSIIDSPSFFL